MTEVYTIYGGDMWRQMFNGVVTILGSDTFTTVLHIVGTFSILGVMVTFIKTRNPMAFLHWLGIFMLITSVLLVPKRSVQIIDITDPAAVYEVDNVPVGLAMIAGLTTGTGFGMAQLYDYTLARPDSLTYTKSGMLFGSQIVAQSSDFRTQNPQLAALLTDYVENCVIGDIMLNNKYTISQLLNSTDPLTLITSNPSQLRGIFQDTGNGRQFVTCQQASVTMRSLMNDDIRVGGLSWHTLATRIFGNRVSADTLLGNAMNDSYGFFYSGGQSAAQIMRNNVTNAAIRDGWKGFAARSSDTANLVNLATESSMTKQRLSWASFGVVIGRTLPIFQSLMMLILIGLFPLVIALALTNHSIFGVNTLKMYAGGFLYFQMWPVMYAILNSMMNFYLQSKTGATPLVLANADQVALQHSDAANIAGYLSASIPAMSFFLTKGAASVASQVVGGVISSGAFSTGGQASTTADGNWSFNNMSMDNVSANKFDTNVMQRSGQQAFQTSNGAMHTQTADGHNVYDTSGAISNLPVNLKLSSLASSGFSEQSRQAQQQAQTALDGYNHSVTSGFQQLEQFNRQSGTSDTITKGSDNSVTSNESRGISQMQSAVESYAKSHNISQSEAFNKLLDITNQGSAGAGGRVYGKFDSGDMLAGKLPKWAAGLSAGAEVNLNADWRHSSGSSHGTQDSHAEGHDYRKDQNSQEAKDFRQGMDMVTSTRLSESGSHSNNESDSKVQQFAATLNDSKSQYHQYTDSTTRSQEFSRMATLAQNQSASLDANYNQEFVDWTTAKYGSDAQHVLTNVNTAQTAATEFMKERLEPEIMQNYAGRTEQTATQALTPSGSLPTVTGNDSQGSSHDPVQVNQRGQNESARTVHQGSTSHGRNSGADENIQAVKERNITPRGSVTSPAIAKDYNSGVSRVNEQAGSLNTPQNIADKVADRNFENTGKIGDIDREISKNKSTVQASSDILKREHQGAVNNQRIGRTEEDIKQTNYGTEMEKNDMFKEKLEQLRRSQNKAS